VVVEDQQVQEVPEGQEEMEVFVQITAGVMHQPVKVAMAVTEDTEAVVVEVPEVLPLASIHIIQYQRLIMSLESSIILFPPDSQDKADMGEFHMEIRARQARQGCFFPAVIIRILLNPG
jgi:hypothetical protein